MFMRSVAKPLTRGWLHAGTAPLALAACTVLTTLAGVTHGAGVAWACGIYLACTVLLFANSGIYHMGTGYWPQRVEGVLQSIDHANIYLLIGGTYTPLAVSLLRPVPASLLLGVVWAGVAFGIGSRIRHTPPRWILATTYVVLGWVAVAFLPQFWSAGGPAIVLLLVAGGVLYTIGAVIFSKQRPDPYPDVFGFHEIFHVCTVVGWTCHCVACFLAVLG